MKQQAKRLLQRLVPGHQIHGRTAVGIVDIVPIRSHPHRTRAEHAWKGEPLESISAGREGIITRHVEWGSEQG